MRRFTVVAVAVAVVSGSHATSVSAQKWPTVRGQSAIESMAFSPDGRWFAVSTARNKGLLYDLKNPRKSRKLAGEVRQVAFAGNGHVVAEVGPDGGDRWLVAWDVKTLKEAYSYSPKLAAADTRSGPALRIAGHPTEPLVLWAKRSASAGAYLVSIAKKTKTRKPSLIGKRHLAFAADGKHIVSGTIIRAWRGKTSRGSNTRVRAVAMSPSGKRIAEAWGYQQLKIYDVAGKLLRTYKEDTWDECFVSGLYFASDDDILFHCTGIDKLRADVALRHLDLKTGKVQSAKSSGKELTAGPVIHAASGTGAWADRRRVIFSKLKLPVRKATGLDRGADVPFDPPTDLAGASKALFESFAGGQIEGLAVLANNRPIKYRLQRDARRGKWRRVRTDDLDKLLDFFSTDNEDGDGYAVAAISIDTRERRFKTNLKRLVVSYDAPNGYFGASFKFKKARGRLLLVRIEAWEQSPQ